MKPLKVGDVAEKETKRLAQVIFCKCGSSFAACLEPMCYTERDWQKDLRKYVNDGCTVKMLYTKEFTFEECTCNAKVDPNQLVIF